MQLSPCQLEGGSPAVSAKSLRWSCLAAAQALAGVVLSAEVAESQLVMLCHSA